MHVRPTIFLAFLPNITQYLVLKQLSKVGDGKKKATIIGTEGPDRDTFQRRIFATVYCKEVGAGERVSESCVVPTVKHGGGSVMV